MMYCQDAHLTIHHMEQADAQPLCNAYNAQGWYDEVSGYMARLQDQAEGRQTVCTVDDDLVLYLSKNLRT